ncbi:MAG TPA: aldo/keto reductase [Allosphingosinicella sp.]|nr:aldo/keto reductase [Allosphingosinicella sp.]
MKLALGTVQFGLDYGAFNTAGRPGEAMVAACLDRAEEAGIDTLDTARAYGESEAVLGRLGAARRFRVVTKVARLDGAGPDAVLASVEASLTALGADQLDALMMHDAADLAGPGGDAVWAVLERLRAEDVIAAAGVSVYTPDEAVTLAGRYPIGIVQAPCSVFDQRMRTSGAFAALQARGVEIHVRSVFLQGFALADPAALPAALARHRPLLERFRAGADAAGFTPLRLALAAVLAEPAIDRVVVGVDGPDQLEEIIAAAESALPELDPDLYASDDLGLINPSLWNAA